MPDFRAAKVTAIQPGGYAVNLTFLDDGSQVQGVQVMSPSASTNTGFNDLASPSNPVGNDPANVTSTGDRDIYALVGFVGRAPVVLGFLFPQVCQMLFADMNRRINRHASDVYTSIDAEGNTEVYHPSGTYLRIGSSPAHEDLTGKDLDGKWKITKNTGAAVHVHLTVANAGSPVASIDIDPSGNITEQNNGNLEATIGGNLTADVAGNLAATVGGTFNATSTGAMTLKGPGITLDTPTVTMTGTLAVQNSSNEAQSTSFSGSIHVTSGDVTADNISLKGHKHTDTGDGTVSSTPLPS